VPLPFVFGNGSVHRVHVARVDPHLFPVAAFALFARGTQSLGAVGKVVVVVRVAVAVAVEPRTHARADVARPVVVTPGQSPHVRDVRIHADVFVPSAALRALEIRGDRRFFLFAAHGFIHFFDRRGARARQAERLAREHGRTHREHDHQKPHARDTSHGIDCSAAACRFSRANVSLQTHRAFLSNELRRCRIAQPLRRSCGGFADRGTLDPRAGLPGTFHLPVCTPSTA
jgi:hypothetical protein